MLAQVEITQIEKWAKKLLQEDYDKFDLHSEMDRKISVAENKTIIREKIKLLFKQQKPQLVVRAKTEAEQKSEYEEQQSKLVFEAEVLELKKSKIIINDKLKIPVEFTKAVARGFHNGFIFTGKCGLGKSYIVNQVLSKEDIKFKLNSGVNSPLAFYEYLYENNDEDTILVFDDTIGLIKNPQVYSILLGVLWGGRAMWNSTKLKIPKDFVFKGRIIFIANTINNDIVKSRCLHYNLEMSCEDKLEMMYFIANKPSKLTAEQRKEIVDYIKDNTSQATKDFDLRTQVKAENLYLFDKDNWKSLVSSILHKDRELQLLEDCLKDCYTMEIAQKKWCEITGNHRATFYRKKKVMRL